MAPFHNESARSVRGSDEFFRDPLTRLIGRDSELAALETLLLDPDQRLLTLTGPPGIGKTRLAMALAARARQQGEASVWFVPLAALSDPALVALSIGDVIGIRVEGDSLILDELAKRIGDGPALLVLDNFEQLLPAAIDVYDLLMRCGGLKVVVTSRASLGLRCEREWSVAPLALPSLEKAEPVRRLAQYASVALLVDRATAVDRQFALSEANARDIAALCVYLEGVPLAIELAATWLKVLSPGELLQRLRRNLATLTGTAADASPRQRAISEAIAWSDELLTDRERRLFYRLAVFAGGWSLTAAEGVCWTDGEGTPVDEIMLSLANKSLIVRHGHADAGARFRMLEMIRAYALEQLERRQLADVYRDRHAAYIGALAEEAHPHLYRRDQPLWLERLDREHANIRAALRWLIATGRREQALRLATNLENFWTLRDHLLEGIAWLEEIIAMPGEIGTEVELAGRRALGTIYLRTGPYERARRLFSRILDQARLTGDRPLAAEMTHVLGVTYWQTGDGGRAEQHFETALEMARACGDQRLIARVLNYLGGVARMAGRDSEAVARYEESLAIWRSLGDRERIAMVLHNMAPVVARQETPGRAAELFEESLDISYSLRNAHGVSLCLMGIAGAASGTGVTALNAARALAASEQIRASVGARWDPDDLVEFARSEAAVRGRLDPAAYAAAREEGEAPGLDEAVALARRLLKSGGFGVRQPFRTGEMLTRREREVAIQVSMGSTNREIAANLSIAEKTVEMHVGRSLAKLGFRSRAQLAAWIAEQGTIARTGAR